MMEEPKPEQWSADEYDCIDKDINLIASSLN